MKPLSTLTVLLSLSLAACGGGGSNPTPQVAVSGPSSTPTTSPSTSPAQSPTPAPANAPTASPTIAPTATPVPASLKRIGGAPLTATASQLSRIRTQSLTQGQGVTNGLPVLVESSGMVAANAGTQVTWVTNIANAQDIAETGGTITPSGTLPINNPGFTPLNCIGSLTAACIVHPLGWQWGTSSANGKPVGNQTLTVAFADGTTSTTNEYVYDGWTLPCNSGWVYAAGVPVANGVKATSDVYADCVAGNIVFPKGSILYSNPVPDQYGRPETIMPTITAAIFLSSSVVNVPMASVAGGSVYGIATQDGGFAKVYFTSQPSAGALTATNGMALHAKPDATYAF